jgi:hypothetical protein
MTTIRADRVCGVSTETEAESANVLAADRIQDDKVGVSEVGLDRGRSSLEVAASLVSG